MPISVDAFKAHFKLDGALKVNLDLLALSDGTARDAVYALRHRLDGQLAAKMPNARCLDVLRILGFHSQPARFQAFVFLLADLEQDVTDLPAQGVIYPLANIDTFRALTDPEKQNVVRWLNSKGPNKLKFYHEIFAHVPGAPAFNAVLPKPILQAISAVVASKLAGPYDTISNRSIRQLAILLPMCRPGGGFAGFAGWGEGDANSESMNRRFHFQKHVLMVENGSNLDRSSAATLSMASQYQSVEQTAALFEPEEAEMEEGGANPTECQDWWRQLDIQLGWDEFVEALKSADPLKIDPVLERGKGWFSFGNRLSLGYVPEFIQSGVIGRNWKLLALLYRYQDDYTNYSIAQSRRFDECVVSSTGDKVFVAGITGEDFIIGRLDAQTGTLGISSCYKPTSVHDKMRSHLTQKAWQLV